ncbi:MAG: CopG family transcriptional regulator [Dehalococcoidia bacterium]
MRTIVDLTDEQLKGLERYRRRKHVSRAAAVREAVDRFLQEESADGLEGIFGAWSHEDAERVRAIVADLRSEWDRE